MPVMYDHRLGALTNVVSWCGALKWHIAIDAMLNCNDTVITILERVYVVGISASRRRSVTAPTLDEAAVLACIMFRSMRAGQCAGCAKDGNAHIHRCPFSDTRVPECCCTDIHPSEPFGTPHKRGIEGCLYEVK